VPGSLQKKGDDDATFCLTKDGILFPRFSLTNPALDVKEAGI
jgi:hypothetical protein